MPEPTVGTLDSRTPFEVSHGVICYPFAFASGSVGILTLPARLTSEDAERLAAYVMALAQPAEDDSHA